MEVELNEQVAEETTSPAPISLWQRSKYFAVSAGSVGVGAALLGMGELSLVPALFAGGIAAYLSPDIRGMFVDKMPAPRGVSNRKAKLAWLLTGNAESEETEIAIEPLPVLGEAGENGQLSQALPAFFTLSDILATGFKPSLEKIFLAFLPDGLLVHARAKGLCHVALAGSTDGGKSSLIRLLMAQLCHAGAQVLLLNPHYTRFDLQSDPPEDWTPFEPYLMADPMECRKYEVIEHYLKHVATELLPNRLEKYAHSQPLGKPYFLVIDELPAIVAKIKEAPEYIAAILREGRKVGIFLITASQDFLVSTIAPGGGGAVRDCFRTAFYVGGDPTTARVLLDIPAKLVPESELGKGTVMLRGGQAKQTSIARVPYVDNQALYALLGPSTYQPGRARAKTEDELMAYMVSGQREEQHTEPVPRVITHVQAGTALARKMERERRLHSIGVAQEQKPTQEERRVPTIQEVREAFPESKPSKRDIQKRFDLTDYQAYKLYGQLDK